MNEDKIIFIVMISFAAMLAIGWILPVFIMVAKDFWEYALV